MAEAEVTMIGAAAMVAEAAEVEAAITTTVVAEAAIKLCLLLGKGRHVWLFAFLLFAGISSSSMATQVGGVSR